VTDADLADLGRTALAFVERQRADPNVDAARERIARQLSTFDGGPDASFLVPLFATPDDLDASVITRTARGAFLRDLRAFYDIGTIVQLAPASGANRPITRLSGVTRSDPPAVVFSHIQLTDGGLIELADPWTLPWAGPGRTPPVAVRRFPSPPSLQDLEVLGPQDVRALIRWGWRVSFAIPDPVENDEVRVTVSYDDLSPQSHPPFPDDTGWPPETRLGSLIALRMLDLSGDALPAEKRLSLAADLAARLAAHLADPPPRPRTRPRVGSGDDFTIAIDAGGAARMTDEGERRVMKGAVTLTFDASPGVTIVTLTAPAEAPGNGACLTGPGAVTHVRMTLRRVRNATIDARPAHPSLVYEGAPVESMVRRPLNQWTPAIRVDMTGRTLGVALQEFFAAIFNGGTREKAGAIEVAAALLRTTQGLPVVTPLFDIPPGAFPGATTAAGYAEAVHARAVEVLRNVLPPGRESAALRLRVTMPGLLEIAAIDFALA
jgi:hypothetical protein